MTLNDPSYPRPAGVPITGTSNVETVGFSPKAVLATAVATILGVVLAILNAVNTPEGAGLLAGAPPIVQVLALVIVPPLTIGLVTYQAAVGRVALTPPR